MHQDDPLVDRLVAGLHPVRPQRAATGWGLLAAAALVTGVAVLAVFGLRPGTAPLAEGRWFVLGELLLAVLGAACALAVIGMASPQRSGRPAAFWAVAAASLMPLAGVVVLAAGGADALAPANEQDHWRCALWGTLGSVLIAATLTLWLRRGAPASPARAGLYTGLASGALGSAIYGLSCPLEGFVHWSGWHFVPVLACALAGRFALPAFLRW